MRWALTQWDLNGNRVAPKSWPNLIENRLKVGTLAVHFIDEDNSRNFIPIRLPPDGFTLRLDPFPCRENHHCSIQRVSSVRLQR